MSKLSITLNGEPSPIEAGWTLTDLLASLDRDPRTVAIEHNGEIVRRPHYGETSLGQGDRVEVVHFVQGG